ncbi:MAG: hypothetical protein LAP85_08255 [Acidobacteriia bacterium]|nr:hypothetical protein [Terriglobia bacterium]
MASETRIRTGRREFDELYPLVRSFLERDILDLSIDGQRIRGYRSADTRSIWIRDHGDMMRTFRYFERDVTSAIRHFSETQAESGRIFDYFTTFPEKLPSERENWTKYVRVPVEADVEYRFVKAAWLAWQATGDDAWIRQLMPRMEKALAYITSHPWYWDRIRGLVKRAYTIDTWDFAYTAGRHDWLQFQITDDTFWGILHGDNSGYYQAFLIMAALWRRFGEQARAGEWEARAATLRDNLNRICWNGRFYTHFVKITDAVIPGVDEAEQLSLSNPMDINRGAATHEQAVSILREYQRRRDERRAFAEWFSIDPPFPDGVFGDERLVRGAYCNGGIMPLVGGELARAALGHGFEAYGVDILRRYFDLVSKTGSTYLWYFPDGRPSSIETSTSPEASPTDGWGSSAMCWALTEGLAGVVDRGRGFDCVEISPRWPAAGIEEAEVSVGYECSERGIAYQVRVLPDKIVLTVDADGSEAGLHVLLPAGAEPRAVRCNGHDVPFHAVTVEQSRYADFDAAVRGTAQFEIPFR